MDRQERRLVRLQERRRPGRQQVRARQASPGRRHGRDRPLLRRRQGHPPRLGPSSAHKGSRPRRRRCRGDLRHPGRVEPAERQGCLQRDAAHLQRLAEGFLQPLSGPAYRLACLPTATSTPRCRRPYRVAKLGLRGLELSCSWDMEPMWHPMWEPLWKAVNDVQLPLHFHTFPTLPPKHHREARRDGSDARCSSPSCRASR